MSTPQYRVGDVVTLGSVKIPKHHIFYVYALIDDDGNSFYVGVTVRPRLRLREHTNPTTSNLDVSELCRRCREPRLVILGWRTRRSEAETMERRLVRRHDHLVNRILRPVTKRSPPHVHDFRNLPSVRQVG